MTVLIKQRCRSFFRKVKPYVAMSMLQFGFAGMYVITQAVLKDGMNHFVLVVYCNVVAFAAITPFALWFERAKRPKMTPVIFLKILALVVIETIGRFIMVGGLYSLLWGKTKEELKISEVAAIEASATTCVQVPKHRGGRR